MLTMNLKQSKAYRFGAYVTAPLVDFFREILEKTKGKRIAVLWVIILFFAVIVFSKYYFVKFSDQYSLGVDLSNVSSNDHILFQVHKKALTYDQVLVGQYIMFHTTKMEPHIPASMSIIKKVVAKEGDHIQVKGMEFFVNGKKMANLRSQALEKLNKTEAELQRDFIVSPNAVVVLGSYERSFDSRYWGELQFKPDEKINDAKPWLF
ncbi:signal peptidase I [Acinetobacter radioresistens]|nr:signal peptidase I [Acinetobacter radioresistens]